MNNVIINELKKNHRKGLSKIFMENKAIGRDKVLLHILNICVLAEERKIITATINYYTQNGYSINDINFYYLIKQITTHGLLEKEKILSKNLFIRMDQIDRVLNSENSRDLKNIDIEIIHDIFTQLVFQNKLKRSEEILKYLAIKGDYPPINSICTLAEKLVNQNATSTAKILLDSLGEKFDNSFVFLATKGNIYSSIKCYEDSISLYMRAKNIQPTNELIDISIGDSQKFLHNYNEALKHYSVRVSPESDNALKDQKKLLLSFRPFYDSAIEKSDCIDDFLSSKNLTTVNLNEAIYGDLFYAAYHDLNFKEIKHQFDSRIKLKAQSQQPVLSSKSNNKILIINDFKPGSSVDSPLIKGLLSHLKSKEITILNIGSPVPQTATELPMINVNPSDSIQLILKLEPSIIIYPAIGMNDATYRLANVRLAKHQIAAWGHPVTTGLSTIDYFISAKWFEPPNCEEHYTEQVVLLDRTGTHMPPPELKPLFEPLLNYSPAPTEKVFLCPGAPYKYQPEFDEFIFKLLDLDTSIIVCFFHDNQHSNSYLSSGELLLKRLHSYFSKNNHPEYYSRLRLLNFMPNSAFQWQLCNSFCVIDSYPFSGYNTIISTLTCRTPIITIEGKYMRGRFGSGILKNIGLDDFVATSLSGAIEICRNLISNQHLTAKFKSIVNANFNSIFSNSSSKDLDIFLNEILNK